MIEIVNDKLFVDGKERKVGKFITQKDFTAFLKKEVKKGRKYTCTVTHCPLAEATGYVVSGSSYGLASLHDDILGPEVPLPAWADSFVEHFDNTEEFPGLPKSKNAKRALFIMENLDKLNDPTFGFPEEEN